MLQYQSYSRALSSLMAGLFALQIVVTGFCLLTDEAHAMPMPAMQSGHIDAPCAKAGHIHKNAASDHSGSCYHCDQPDELSNASFSSFAQVSILLPGVITMPVAAIWKPESIELSSRTPTGPPRSSSLLYTTSQRIRI